MSSQTGMKCHSIFIEYLWFFEYNVFTLWGLNSLTLRGFFVSLNKTKYYLTKGKNKTLYALQ